MISCFKSKATSLNPSLSPILKSFLITLIDSEISKLESITLDLADIYTMELYQVATSQIIPTKNNNRLIIALAFIGSFMLSILCVLLMNAFKEEDVTSI